MDSILGSFSPFITDNNDLVVIFIFNKYISLFEIDCL